MRKREQMSVEERTCERGREKKGVSEREHVSEEERTGE